MVKLNISLNSNALLQLQSALASAGAGSLPRTAGAVKSGAAVVRDVWRGFAGGGSLPGVESLKRPNGGYARSIKIQRNGPFDYEIYSGAKVAEWIEHGTEALDMKETHTRGPRSRVSKKGVSYLIVPFRWGTPNATGFKNIMPEQVYNIVKNKKRFEKSRVLMTAHNEPNARGEAVERREYDWGDRYTPGDGEQYFDSEDNDITGRLSGMVSMDGQNKNGKKVSSGYLTFRIISADSPQGSWIKPAMPARPVTRSVASVTRNAINEIVEGAVMEDLRNL